MWDEIAGDVAAEIVAARVKAGKLLIADRDAALSAVEAAVLGADSSRMAIASIDRALHPLTVRAERVRWLETAMTDAQASHWRKLQQYWWRCRIGRVRLRDQGDEDRRIAELEASQQRRDWQISREPLPYWETRT